MRRFGLLGAVLGGLVVGIAACRETPLQPGPSTTTLDSGPLTAKSTTPKCEDLIYPYTLCATSYRPALCAALNNGGVIENIPYGSRTVTADFKRTSNPLGAQETATTYYPYGYPPSVMTFPIVTQTQINSSALCG